MSTGDLRMKQQIAAYKRSVVKKDWTRQPQNRGRAEKCVHFYQIFQRSLTSNLRDNSTYFQSLERPSFDPSKQGGAETGENVHLARVCGTRSGPNKG
jgi:hypothetical protein